MEKKEKLAGVGAPTTSEWDLAEIRATAIVNMKKKEISDVRITYLLVSKDRKKVLNTVIEKTPVEVRPYLSEIEETVKAQMKKVEEVL